MSPNETVQRGVCPNCDLEGPAGAPCTERGCAKRGYHFLPREYATWSDPRRPHPLVGRLVGRYLAVKVLASGGFGTVLLALQQGMPSKRAAVKVLHPQEDPALQELFLRKFRAEAEALAVVSHPNVVQLLEFGERDGEPYLVMEFVDGARTLADEIHARSSRGRGFTADEVRTLLEQAANGLEAAHDKGIVHRDVKPENLMLQSVAGNPLLVRLVDFGLARFEARGTLTTKAMGTPTYMAPEQLHLQEVGPWTDLYALGVVAYELLTGRLPFPGRTVQEIIAKKIDPAYEPLAGLADLHLAPVAEAFLRRALARDARDRYRTAGQFKAGLAAAYGAFPDPDVLRRRHAEERRHRQRETLPLTGAPPSPPPPAPRPPGPEAELSTAGRWEFVDPPPKPKPTSVRSPGSPMWGGHAPLPSSPAPLPTLPQLRGGGTSRPARTWGVLLAAVLGLALPALLLIPDATGPAPVVEAAPDEPPPDPACEPDCEGRVCGPDGCGGSCGECPEGRPCREGECCVCDSGPCCDGCRHATSTPACWKHLQGLKSPVTPY